MRSKVTHATCRYIRQIDLRGARKRIWVTPSATVRSLGALRQPRDDTHYSRPLKKISRGFATSCV
jgi:hypothetical protein